MYFWYLTFKANRLANSNVKIEKGIYRVVRHPIYACIIGFSFFVLPFLISPWIGICMAAILSVLLVTRAIWEENRLQQELPGYKAYMQKVRYRFVPGVW